MNVSEYALHIDALRAKRQQEKARLLEYHKAYFKQYRWCAADERLPFKLVDGWSPVVVDGKPVLDKELVLCARRLSWKSAVQKVKGYVKTYLTSYKGEVE